MTPEQTLESAAKARALPRGAIGYFGDDLPRQILQGRGVSAVDVALAPAAPDMHPDVARITEPFMDRRSVEFLNRLAAGAFDDLSGIVFCRDDAAALPAYQYATELRRTGVLDRGPAFFLWNLLHGTTGPIATFNARQATRLAEWLPATKEGDDGRTLAAQGEALKALARAQDEARVSGETAMIWRLAGRWMDPASHADALTAAVTAAMGDRDTPRPGRRIALLGAACDQPQLYAALETAGTIVCDLTQLGNHAPRPTGQAATDLAAIAVDPFHPRGTPSDRYRPAILQAIAEARCDLVVVQLDETDHSFGWDLPSLTREVSELGIRLVHLGFRPLRPDAAWYARAARLLQGEPA
ncbi:2-hydroxyacyl-CoA dehydratase family protein [Oceanicola sp. S124]|uniref:2-hydroxyacyl-CoA dehydratase family protein n=1 Tax=Oceanicola sp. S124 TaxID=1042378 RepID=UPI0002558C9E|nr:2-hydroxyacyl-CoA dehydratase family protein [Oceanicola sp. S124]